MEMRIEVISSVSAQDMDTTGYQVFELEDLDFDWENPDLNMDAISQPSIDTLFSLQLLTTLG